MRFRVLALVFILLGSTRGAHAAMDLAIGVASGATSLGSSLDFARAPNIVRLHGRLLDHAPFAVAVAGGHRAVVTDHGELSLWDEHGNQLWLVGAVDAGPGSRLVFGAGGLTLVVANASRVRVYSAEDGSLLHSRTFSNAVKGLASHGGRRSISASHGLTDEVREPTLIQTGGSLLFYDALSDTVVDSIAIPVGQGLAVDGDHVAWYVDASGKLISVDLITNAVAASSPGSGSFQPPVAPSQDGSRVAVGGTDVGKVVIWSVSDQKVVRTFTPFVGDVTGLVMPDATTVIATTQDTRDPGATLKELDIRTGDVTRSSSSSVACIAGEWVPDTESADLSNLDATVSSRASQESVDAVKTTVDTVKTSVDAVKTRVDSNLDAKVSTRASQSSLDALAASVATRASQSSLDALDADVATRASQSSLDALDADVATRASQSSLDALATDVASRSSQDSVDALASDLDARASQSSVDALASDVATRASQSSLDALGADVGTRASQASLDALAAAEQDRADSDAEEHGIILSRLDGGSRQQIEMALAAGALQPLFMIPAGPDADPAAAGLTCPGLPPSGTPAIDPDGLFEVVRCVTRRSLDDLRAIGEDTTRAEREFADAEAARTAMPPRYREAAENYAAAMQVATRGR